MIVASRGRLLAKEAGTDRIFHMVLDELFRTSQSSVRQNIPGVQTRPARFSVLGDPPVPSSYLKLDPEFFTTGLGFNVPGAFDADYANHPASLRFKLFGELMRAETSDMMCVMMAPLTWYLLDTRSPLKIFDIEDLHCIGDDELKEVATKERIKAVIQGFLTPIRDELAAAAGDSMASLVDDLGPQPVASAVLDTASSNLIVAINTIDRILNDLFNIPGFGVAARSLLRDAKDLVDDAAQAHDDLVEAANDAIEKAAEQVAEDIVKLLADSLVSVFSEIFAIIARAEIQAEGFAALFGPALLGAGLMASQLKKEGVIRISGANGPSTGCSERTEISVNLQKAFEFFKESDNRALRILIDELIEAAREKRGARIPNAPPAGLPTYAHVMYERRPPTDNPDSQRRDSINFDKVMDLGIGTSHWAEHWVSSFGGEIHSLLHRRPLFQQEQFSLAMYRFLNGPVIDGDCFVDGTTNFYMLVSLPVVVHSSEITGGTAAELARRRYAILWLDEQTYFTQRWRLLHPTLDTSGDAVSLARQLRYNPEYFRFELSCFWDPFAHDCIHSRSRMAVSRQIIAVSGHDQLTPDSPDFTPEIYTICFAFGMCDYTWRWRRFPLTTYQYLAEDVVGGNGQLPARTIECLHPNTLGLREDATLHVRGFKRSVDGRSLIEGRWFQKYLPADCRHVPRRHELVSNRKPAVGFSHPWDFVSEDCYRNADRFYQFGVYQTQIDARSQYYEVELLPYENNVIPPVDPAEIWINGWRNAPDGKPLRIDTINFNWAIPQDGDGYTRPADLALDRSKEDLSLHEAKTRFRLLDRGPLGLIAVFCDKRDDDLHAASHLPQFTMFENENPASRNGKLRVLVRGHRRVVHPPVVQKVQVRLNRSQGRTVSVTFSFWTSLSVDEAYEGLWRFSLAALNNREVVPLFSAGVFGTFTRQGVPREPLPLNFSTDEVLRPEFQYVYVWQGFDNTVAAALDRFCTPSGRMLSGTSAWFEDIVGHPATPDMIEFSVA